MGLCRHLFRNSGVSSNGEPQVDRVLRWDRPNRILLGSTVEPARTNWSARAWIHIRCWWHWEAIRQFEGNLSQLERWEWDKIRNWCWSCKVWLDWTAEASKLLFRGAQRQTWVPLPGHQSEYVSLRWTQWGDIRVHQAFANAMRSFQDCMCKQGRIGLAQSLEIASSGE